MDLGLGDGRRGRRDSPGQRLGGVWRGLRLGLEAAAKIAISLRLCLEPHLKQENIFCPPPHMARGLGNPLGIASSRIVNKTVPNVPVNTAETQKFGISAGILAEAVTVVWYPTENDSNQIQFNLSLNIVSLWCVLNALDCNILNNTPQLFLFCAQLETTPVKNISHRALSIHSPLHPPITKDIKSMAMCCHFSLHSWLYIEGYAAVMTLRDGVLF